MVEDYTEFMNKFNSDFIELVKSNFDDPTDILNAFDFATYAHRNDRRLSGEPYIIHPISVATILIDMGMDKETIMAALLHDVVEDTPVSFKKIRENFGPEVEMLVKGVSKISSLKCSNSNTKELNSLKRMFIAMSKDIRVILIKLADRLHNIRTVDALRYEKRIKFCSETMNLFVPLAERLGLNNLKLEMEDKCFSILNPEEYLKLKNELDRKFDKTTQRMKVIDQNLNLALKNLELDGKVKSRFKHFYSLYKKIKSVGTAKIYDIIAFRILVNNVDDCYRVLGEIHKMYRPVAGRIKDYIASPKPNGYKSLHTTLITKDGTPFEVQIRTFEMHRYCEYGIAAHWRYKTGDDKKDILDEKLNWIKSVVEGERQIKDSENFIKALQMDFSTAEIWVFTPKYKPISLPENATPIDFAYAIHTELGNTCIGARVNGNKVPLSYKLEMGDVVEIIASKESKGPSRDWLKIAVGAGTRAHIRNFFKKRIKPENIKAGRIILEQKAKELKVSAGDCLSPVVLEEVKKKYLIYSLDDMFSSIAIGVVNVEDIFAITKALNKQESDETDDYLVLIESSEVDGVKLARCCNPIPGDDLYGVSSNSGIIVHCADCDSLKDIEEERLLLAEWKNNINRLFETSLKITCIDKIGIASDIINVFYNTNTIILNLIAKLIGDGKSEFTITFRVRSKSEIDVLKKELEKIENVSYVKRV